MQIAILCQPSVRIQYKTRYFCHRGSGDPLGDPSLEYSVKWSTFATPALGYNLNCDTVVLFYNVIMTPLHCKVSSYDVFITSWTWEGSFYHAFMTYWTWEVSFTCAMSLWHIGVEACHFPTRLLHFPSTTIFYNVFMPCWTWEVSCYYVFMTCWTGEVALYDEFMTYWSWGVSCYGVLITLFIKDIPFCNVFMYIELDKCHFTICLWRIGIEKFHSMMRSLRLRVEVCHFTACLLHRSSNKLCVHDMFMQNGLGSVILQCVYAMLDLGSVIVRSCFDVMGWGASLYAVFIAFAHEQVIVWHDVFVRGCHFTLVLGGHSTNKRMCFVSVGKPRATECNLNRVEPLRNHIWVRTHYVRRTLRLRETQHLTREGSPVTRLCVRWLQVSLFAGWTLSHNLVGCVHASPKSCLEKQ